MSNTPFNDDTKVPYGTVECTQFFIDEYQPMINTVLSDIATRSGLVYIQGVCFSSAVRASIYGSLWTPEEPVVLILTNFHKLLFSDRCTGVNILQDLSDPNSIQKLTEFVIERLAHYQTRLLNNNGQVSPEQTPASKARLEKFGIKSLDDGFCSVDSLAVIEADLPNHMQLRYDGRQWYPLSYHGVRVTSKQV